MAGREVYQFGDFTLNVPERCLSKQGESIRLPPKSHDVLVALVRKAGTLVTKRELLELVWPKSFVEEGILAVHVSTLRKTLGSGHAGRRWIETVSRSGYRFTCTVTEIPATGPRRWSISVLPSLPFSEDGPQSSRHIDLAISDAVITRLGRSKELAVSPVRMTQGYTDPKRDAPAIGRSLGVDAVLDMRFSSTPDRVRVHAYLVRSKDGGILWSRAMDQYGAGVTAVAESVVQSLIAHLGLDYSPGARNGSSATQNSDQTT